MAAEHTGNKGASMSPLFSPLLVQASNHTNNYRQNLTRVIELITRLIDWAQQLWLVVTK